MSRLGDWGGRRGGEPKAAVVLSGASRIAAFTATVESGSFSAKSASFDTGIEFAGGLAGLFFMGLDGD